MPSKAIRDAGRAMRCLLAATARGKPLRKAAAAVRAAKPKPPMKNGGA